MSPGSHVGPGRPDDLSHGARPPSGEEIRASARGRQEHLPFGHKIKRPGEGIGSTDAPKRVKPQGGRVPTFPTPPVAPPPPRREPPKGELRPRGTPGVFGETPTPARSKPVSIRPAWTKPVKARPVERPVDTTPSVPRPFLASAPPPIPRARATPAASAPPPAAAKPRAPGKAKPRPMAGSDEDALEKRFGKLEL